MRRLVREEAHPCRGLRLIRTGAEEDVRPGGEGDCLDGAGEVVRLAVRMDADAGEIGAETLLQMALHGAIEGAARRRCRLDPPRQVVLSGSTERRCACARSRPLHGGRIGCDGPEIESGSSG
jgi:hypothetical protein